VQEISKKIIDRPTPPSRLLRTIFTSPSDRIRSVSEAFLFQKK
jgi:hypothetical protein